MSTTVPAKEERKVAEAVLQESYVCPFYDPTNPNHNSDKKLCNVCETCVALQITRSQTCNRFSDIVENIDCDSLGPENSELVTHGFSKPSNSWECYADCSSDRHEVTCTYRLEPFKKHESEFHEKVDSPQSDTRLAPTKNHEPEFREKVNSPQSDGSEDPDRKSKMRVSSHRNVHHTVTRESFA